MDQAELAKRHRSVMPDWIALYYDQPISLVRGEGRYVWDAAGERYLDWFGGILTTSTGYGTQSVVDAVKKQADEMLHTSTLYLIEKQVELAELISDLSPIDDAKVFFTTSGTEANDTALMLATGWRRSNQVLAIRNSYHGRSFGAMAITGNRAWRASSLSPFNVSYVHGSYRYRSPWREMPDADYIDRCVDDLKSVISTCGADDIACLIAEPIQGVGGFATPPDGLFKAYHEVLAKEGILFISDEVQTGWGRTGDHFWGISAHDVAPDIMTFAKGIGNGLTIGGVVARREIMDSVNAGSISTFGGNPLSMAGSLANLRYILENNLQQNCQTVGTFIIDELRRYSSGGADAALPLIGDVRGKGLMFALELVEPGSDTANPKAAALMMEATRERGLLIGKGGLEGNVLRFAPPMTLTRQEAEEGLQILLTSLGEVQKELHGIEMKVLEEATA